MALPYAPRNSSPLTCDDISTSFCPTKTIDITTPKIPIERPIAPPVIPFDRFLQALINIVGHFRAVTLLEVIMRMISVEEGFVEAGIQPSAPFAVQRCRNQMAETDKSKLLHDHYEDENSAIG